MNRFGWLAAMGLVVVTNTVVMAGVLWNRSGEPEAVLHLTERELPVQHRYVGADEDTGVALRLTPHSDSHSPDWLDGEKLQALGFSVSETAASLASDSRYLKRALPREAWVVYEYDGPAWQEALAKQERKLDSLRDQLVSGQATQQQVDLQEKSLQEARLQGSRLVAVDAGKDPAALRTRYSDSTRYLIAEAEVNMWFTRERLGEAKENSQRRAIAKGRLELMMNSIHVPLPHRNRLQDIVGGELHDARQNYGTRAPRYSVELHYGRRHQPWVEAVDALHSGYVEPRSSLSRGRQSTRSTDGTK